MRKETAVHFLFGTVILGLLSIFKKSQASSPYEALNSLCLSRGQRDVRPPVQIRRTPTASKGDSDMPSSCEMKDEPEFNPLQGNRAFFESGHLGVHSTSDRKQRVPLTSLLLKENSSCVPCGMLADHFSQRHGISSHLRTIRCAWSFPRVAVLKLIFI